MNVHYSSKTDEWFTPQKLFDELNQEFNFDLDVCANSDNAKCQKYFNKKINGLNQLWVTKNLIGSIWMKPPYGREIGKWVRKAYNESYISTATIVCLLPARTDTRWFHDYIYNKAEIRFLKGRLKFGDAKNSAPFPSMIVIYKKKGVNTHEGARFAKFSTD
jgi:site-specific DNA-methyltransferase (adenine-specific)